MYKNINIYFGVFFLSGVSGLIYESIWSHYLKLFLGHAAYAQTLVLAIFMGGMAIGSWICSQKGNKWKNLLLGYAVVEGVIGIMALVFHEAFDALIHLSYQSIMPAIGSQALVSSYKWFLSATIILPQSILLGMTFPLMSAGVIRLFPSNPGRTVSMLYFSNSIGAALGVLVSGFLFIDWFGLPGTIRLAGILNICIAIFIWKLVANRPPAPATTPAPTTQPATTKHTDSFYFLFLTIAFLTGLASFIYEVSWIRMLSLVLGSSTHAFELMLSAFILGLALGGLWIRNRIDKIGNTIKFLAIVQLIMGLLALSTLPLYNITFDAMQWVINNLDKNNTGYLIFNFSSHAIATAVMLPTTFFAGMTLPLITFTLLKRGDGEKSIGAVYAANTIGAICGVLLAIHIGLPHLGLKNTLWVGASIDILLAIILLAKIRPNIGIKPLTTTAVTGVAALILVMAFIELDVYKMGSGVYRSGALYNEGDVEVLYHKDGKSASVDLHKSDNGYISIRTNGKIDATIKMSSNNDMSVDEPTMVLAAALPIYYNPTAKHAAVIGMGSGLTTHTLLTSSSLTLVDTIEIEPAIVEAAKGFRPRVELAYTDPRSHIYIEDAKTYFSTHNKKYDIIISEPSNPWVSGTASLFTKEFYRVVKNYLQSDGILVQWIQLYEFNTELVATIVKALSKEFSDYSLYISTDFDLLIVAKNEGKLNTPSASLFSQPKLAAELNTIGIRHSLDFETRKIGNRDQLSVLFKSYDIPSNSDYFPELDLRAAKARYLTSHSSDLVALTYQPIPVLRYLSPEQPLTTDTVTNTTTPSIVKFHQTAIAVYDAYINVNALPGHVPDKYNVVLTNISNVLQRCYTINTTDWVDNLLEMNSVTTPFLNRAQLNQVWQKMHNSRCYRQLPDPQKDWLALMLAVANKDAGKMTGVAQWLLQHNVAANERHYDFLVGIAMLGELLLKRNDQAKRVFTNYQDKLSPVYNSDDLTLQLLLAYANENN